MSTHALSRTNPKGEMFKGTCTKCGAKNLSMKDMREECINPPNQRSLVMEKHSQRKTYAIGDLHGRFDLLCEAISLAENHAGVEGGVFVVCGDFIDRGPQSRAIIDLLLQGPTSSNWEWVVLKGNHEDMMLQCLELSSIQWWVGNGGGQTLQSYGYSHGDQLHPLKIPQEHLDWLRDLPIYHIDQHRAFVHAGFNPALPLEEQNEQEMMWQRDPRNNDYSFMGKHVVHGHEQYADGPILTKNKSNIDTFAWLHGRLAVAVFDEKAGGPTEVLWAVKEPYERMISLKGASKMRFMRPNNTQQRSIIMDKIEPCPKQWGE